jgi:carbon monoxide dehydrogenase subunit G
MAEFNGSSKLSRSVAQLLEASGDPAAIASLLPGCEALHRTDEEHIEGRLATEVAGIPVTAAVSVRRTVETLTDGAARLHLRLKVRPDIGGHAVVAAIIDLTPASGDASATDASWRASSELDPMLAVMAGQRVEEFLRASMQRLIEGLGAAR